MPVVKRPACVVLRTSAGEKLAVILTASHDYVWLRKWRRNSNRWTQVQRLRWRDVEQPTPPRDHHLIRAAEQAGAFDELPDPRDP